MAIDVECRNCGKKLRVKDELGGKKGKCPGCGAIIDIRLPEEADEIHAEDQTAAKEMEKASGNSVMPVIGWTLFVFFFLSILIDVLIYRLYERYELFIVILAWLSVCFSGVGVFGSWVFVLVDGLVNKLDVLKYSKLELSMTDRSSVACWVIACIFFWIIFYPMYLIKRPKLVRAARRTILEGLYMNDEEKQALKRNYRRRSSIYWAIVLIILAALVIWVAFF